MSGPDVEGVLAAHRAIVSGDEDGWHVVCTCGHREPGDSTVAHVAAAVSAEVGRWLEGEGAFRVAAETIWTTSRADEATISVIGAKHAATAALAALAEQVAQVASVGEGEGS